MGTTVEPKEREQAERLREYQLKIAEAKRRLAKMRYELAARRWHTGVAVRRWEGAVRKQSEWS